MINVQQLAKFPALRALPIKRWAKKFNAMPQRDRMAILAGGLALIIGIEFQVVMGLHDRRVSLLSSQPEADPAMAQQEALTLAKQQQELARLQAELARRSPVQTISTDGAAPKDVFATLKQALALKQVAIIGLKAIPAEEPVSTKPAETSSDEAAVAEDVAPSGDGQPPQDGAVAAAAPAKMAQQIYRHRIELRVAGSVGQVSSVVKDFEGTTQPLRLERIKVVAAKAGSPDVEALLELVLISRERTWLAM